MLVLWWKNSYQLSFDIPEGRTVELYGYLRFPRLKRFSVRVIMYGKRLPLGKPLFAHELCNLDPTCVLSDIQSGVPNIKRVKNKKMILIFNKNQNLTWFSHGIKVLSISHWKLVKAGNFWIRPPLVPRSSYEKLLCDNEFESFFPTHSMIQPFKYLLLQNGALDSPLLLCLRYPVIRNKYGWFRVGHLENFKLSFTH